MKATPLLFTPENAQKCHVGTKTQTRRLVKGEPLVMIRDFAGDAQDPSPLAFQYVTNCDRIDDDSKEPYRYTGVVMSLDEYPEEGFVELPCPYGTVGDRLWCRHTVWMTKPVEDWEPHCWNPLTKQTIWKDYGEGGPQDIDEKKWKKIPAIHMPRWACRTWLEITAVRVEQLGSISEEDARAEGVNGVDEFIERWKSINNTWEPSLWVWVLAFQKVAA